MVFCNLGMVHHTVRANRHNPYFNRWFSAICRMRCNGRIKRVTILILIDGFLQLFIGVILADKRNSHNPYFNRWFSAICTKR